MKNFTTMAFILIVIVVLLWIAKLASEARQRLILNMDCFEIANFQCDKER